MKKQKVDLSSLTPEEREARRKKNKRFNRILYTAAALLILIGVYIILNDQTLYIKKIKDFFAVKVPEKYNEVVNNVTPVPKPTLPPFPAYTLDPESPYDPWNDSNEDDWTQWWENSYFDPRYTTPPMPTVPPVVDVTAPPPTPTPRPGETAPPPTPSPSPTPTWKPETPVYGDPSPTPYNPYEPKAVYFIEHDINCPVQPVGYNQYGQMAVVQSAYVAGWFRYGGDPVHGGNTLIAGHIRHKGRYGYFSIIRDGLQPGEYVIVEMQNGQFAYYVVDRIEAYVYYDVPDSIMTTGGQPRLTLITCMDDYSAYYGTSLHRIFAICYPVYFENPNPTDPPATEAPVQTPDIEVTPEPERTEEPDSTEEPVSGPPDPTKAP